MENLSAKSHFVASVPDKPTGESRGVAVRDGCASQCFLGPSLAIAVR